MINLVACPVADDSGCWSLLSFPPRVGLNVLFRPETRSLFTVYLWMRRLVKTIFQLDTYISFELEKGGKKIFHNFGKIIVAFLSAQVQVY